MQPIDPVLFMADQMARELLIAAVRLIPWIPVVLGTAYLHARWSRAKK